MLASNAIDSEPARCTISSRATGPGRECQVARSAQHLPQSPGPASAHNQRSNVKSDTIRIETYDAKTAPTTVSLKVASMLAPMKSLFATRCASFVAWELLIQGNLNQSGSIPTIQYPFYLNFGREIGGLATRGIAGNALILMATSLHAKYVAFGLDTAMLKLIADDVFSVTIP